MTKNGKKIKERIKQNIPLILMALPGVILTIMFSYVPLFGSVLAFKDYSYRRGIWGSEWVGLDNFKYIFGSNDIVRAIGNTIGYNLLFMVTIMGGGIVIAILLYWVKSKRAARVYQECVQIPYLLSMAVIGTIVYIFLKSDGGVLNMLLEKLGGEAVSFYTEPKYWTAILVLVNFWFGAGIKSIYFYASLMGIDHSLFEAADMDGAKWYHKVFNIMLPSIAPMIALQLITTLGAIVSASNFALFHSVTMDSSALYSVTDVLSTYEYRGLTMGNIGTTTALGLFTSLVTFVLTMTVNQIVKKISPENAMF